ncbi:hypothetical protein MMC27_002593 [Xylographa pallens]|nr:hypothetical protein [Xylographa pallens]
MSREMIGIRKYVHQSLSDGREAIRLMELFPRQSDELPKCRLFETTVSTSPSYQALSYTWGSDEKPRYLHTNDMSYIPITENLFTALCHLTERTKSRIVWVDAICIDQDSDTERNHQVRFMSLIFRRAERVIVWLGISRDSMLYGYGNSNTLESGTKSYDDEIKGKSREPVQEILIVREHLFSQDQEQWRQLLHSPWFERAWVLQEVVYASRLTIRFDIFELEWSDLIKLSSFVNRDSNTLSSDPVCVASANRISSMQTWRVSFLGGSHLSSRPQLEDVIHDTRTSKCKKQVDKIYSVLSLALRDDGEILFQPDYRLCLNDVELKLAKASLETNASLDLLRYVEHTEATIALPSWVPHWQPSQGYPLPLREKASLKGVAGKICRLVRHSTPSLVNGKPQEMDLLILRGSLVFQIECVGSTTFSSKAQPNHITKISKRNIDVEAQIIIGDCHSDSGWLEISTQDRQDFAQLSPSRSSMQDRQKITQLSPYRSWKWMKGLRDKFNRKAHRSGGIEGLSLQEDSKLDDILVQCDPFPRSHSLTRNNSFIAKFPTLSPFEHANRNIILWQSPYLNNSWSTRLPITPSDVADGRKVALTRGRTRALVPATTEPGDFIAAFLGIRLLFIIRPYHDAPRGKTWYVLVGACDIEEDLPWDGLEAKADRLREIVLC